MNTAQRYLLLVSLAALLPLSTSAEPRLWRDASGQFSVEAEMVKVENGTVFLRKTSGTVVEVPLAKLSPADQHHIESVLSPPPPVEAAVAEPAAEEAEETEESPPKTFWGGVRTAMETFDSQGEHGKRTIRRFQTLAGLLPEWAKRPATPIILFLSALVLFVPAYIWLLRKEFEANPAWGMAQIFADFIGACLVPFLGLFVALLFTFSHFREAWKAIVFYCFVSFLFFCSFLFVSSDLYEGLGITELEETTEQEENAKGTEEKEAPRSYRPGKYRAPVENMPLD